MQVRSSPTQIPSTRRTITNVGRSPSFRSTHRLMRPFQRSNQHEAPCPVFAPSFWREGGRAQTPPTIVKSKCRHKSTVPCFRHLFSGAKAGKHKLHQRLSKAIVGTKAPCPVFAPSFWREGGRAQTAPTIVKSNCRHKSPVPRFRAFFLARRRESTKPDGIMAATQDN